MSRNTKENPNISERPNISESPGIFDLRCQFCQKSFEIETLDDTASLASILAHYRDTHLGQFMSYCGHSDPKQREVIELYIEIQKLENRDKEKALERLLELERRLLADSLLLATRLGTFRDIQERIKALT